MIFFKRPRGAIIATTLLPIAQTSQTAFADDPDLANCLYSNGLPIQPNVCKAFRDRDARDAQMAELMRAQQERKEREFQAQQAILAGQRELAAKHDEERKEHELQAQRAELAAQREMADKREEQARTYRAEQQARTEARAKAAAAPLTTAEVNEQVKLDERCIRSSDASIAQQKAIGEEVGFVDKRALYVAAVNKLACKRHIAQLAACKKAGHCARGTSNQGPISYTLPPSDMP